MEPWRKRLGPQPFQIRRFNGRNGRAVAILVDEKAGPAFYPNVFVTAAFVKANRSPETCVKALASIAMARCWAKSRGADLDLQLRTGDLLSIEEVESLADYLLLSARAQAEQITPVKNHGAGTQILRPFGSRPQQAMAADSRLANPKEAAVRIHYVAEYFDWHLKLRLGSLERLKRESADLRTLGEQLLSRLRQRGRGFNISTSDDETLDGIPAEMVDKITAALAPGSPDNPFEPGFVQDRNHLLWLLYASSGARRAEIQSVLVRDVVYANRTVFVRRSKTQPRDVFIGKEGAEAFDSFVETHWSRLPKAARKHGQLFTDKQGRLLSLRQVNRIFERIRAMLPDAPGYLTPHTMRRTWNDRFSELVDQQPPDKRMDPEQEIRIRNKLQGWSPQSEMGAQYARRHIRKRADDLAERLANNIIERGSGERGRAEEEN